ncbi:MAG TPA: serine--tRNA ligase [Actinomycetota bacterium]|nr:serine--tRNA ligase [Actinomycetota bacterium]
MLDLKLIREDPDAVDAALKRRGAGGAVQELLDLDKERRGLQARIDELRAEQKSAGREVAKLQGDEKKQLLARLKTFSDELVAIEQQEQVVAARLRDRLLLIPNLPHESVPDGAGEDDNVVLRTWGEARGPSEDLRHHLDVGEALGIIDVERAARASGSRFAYLQGGAALLWLGLSRFVIETLARNGHTPVLPPVLVRREAMEGTGFFPGSGEEQIYRIPDDELYLVGTSEVPLAALHMGEILTPDQLPLRYVAQSSCFRREAGAHGKDVRGIIRLHQFEKVEMFVFTTPEQSWEEHERLIAVEEEILQALGLPYRAVALCTGDLGGPSARTIDLEVWFPGQGRYIESTSCSNTTDYQARRLNTRYRTDDGPRFTHTLNGTAATSSRHIAAIIENYQRSDGGVDVPDVLRPYVGADVIPAR